jgi:beta-lactamase superfamily II metal-dependent hydrolase
MALVALALCVLAWRAWPDGRLRVIFLETRGDAALIQTPAGRYVLIDGGSDPAALAAALGRQMPFWRHTLDMVVLTTAEGSSLPGAIAALARYQAGGAIAPPRLKRGAWGNEWRRLLAEQHTPVHVARAGERFDLGGATLRVLAPGDGDAAGMVLRLDYGATSVVFDQSGGPADEDALAARPLGPASLLVFPWQRDPHVEFVAALRPTSMVLTDGRQADRPAELTFGERAVGRAALYHERLDGTITWMSDGARSWVETER